jgi:hypothetical protein
VSEQVEKFCALARLGVADGSVTKEILESFGVKSYVESYVSGDFEVLKLLLLCVEGRVQCHWRDPKNKLLCHNRHCINY